MKTFPLPHTLRRSLGACSIALGLLAALPAAATQATFTAPGQTLGFDVTLDLNALAKPSTIRWLDLNYPIDNEGPYFGSISYKVYGGTGGTGNLVYSDTQLPSLLFNLLDDPEVRDGTFSVLLTMTSNPGLLAFGNLGGRLLSGGVGADLTATARLRPIDLSSADYDATARVAAIQQATVPEPGSLALVALAGLLAAGLKLRAARG